MSRVLAALLLLCAPLAAALAHPLAPALLELRETAPAQYEVLWRTSVARAQGVDVAPRLPAQCRESAPAPAQLEGREALVLRWMLDCAPEGLAGRDIAIDGLDRGRINVILRLAPLKGEPQQTLLDAEQPRYRVSAPGAAPPVFRNYLGLGMQHLLLGFDHLLFVTGLVLLVRRLRALLLTVTAFTLGHSLTLALATLGMVHLNQALTETGIALSILLLANEVVQTRPSWLARWPWAMACAFGLLHGLGFAGALSEVGLPQTEIPLALFAFNIGIELGQLAVVAGLLALGALWRVRPSGTHAWPAAAELMPAYLMGSLAAYWLFARSALLFQ